MERIQSINPERINWCCADRGITPGNLASDLGIALASIEQVMDRKDGLTFNQLRKIAKYFNRGVLFFLEESNIDDAKVHSPQFRTLANQKQKISVNLKALIERAETQRAVYLSLREDLDDADMPKFSPVNISQKSPRAAADIIRQWLGTGKKNNFDTYRSVVEAHGALVFRSNGYKGKWQIDKEDPILGFSLYDPICPVIFIKKQRSEARQSFTLMHELGHLLLDKSSSIDDTLDLQSHEGEEHIANVFAGNLLVPDNFLETIRDKERPGNVSQYEDWLKPQCQEWGVSSEVILRRLMDAGRLSQTLYANYRDWLAGLVITVSTGKSRKYRFREPRHVFGDTYVRTVLDALNTQHITLARASTYLDNLKIKDLHRLENDYAGL
jgi:Zn-dependent peptidase ImmA (M78 family)/plasmid maintenance system antidote protein VapI